MAAFLVSLFGSGWRPGDSFPTGAPLATASGAAFLSVVFGQAANAFACRSSTRWPGALGWTANRYLLPAIAIGGLFSLVVVYVPVIAAELEQRGPSLAGWLMVLASGPVVLGVDATDKWRRRRSAHRVGPVGPAVAKGGGPTLRS